MNQSDIRGLVHDLRTSADIDIQISYERWLISRNEDASKRIFVATGILVFDFDLFIGDRFCYHT